jgi:GH25 family lysozyme M1 (1,4-beta-N-acetylmuramidase)
MAHKEVTMTPQFVDVSQFQPVNLDWKAYKAWSAQGDGISRVAIRSSYGVGYKDVHFDQYRAGALAAGIDQILFYHYSYPSINSAINEANSQHSIVGAIRPHDLLILDFEEGVSAATSSWAYNWLAQQEANYDGKLPGIYASSGYIIQRLQDNRLAKYPLWLANWQFTPDERPPVPSPWTAYEFVQYTDNATNVPGIPGTVDCNIYLGVSIPTQEEDTVKTIDLSDPTVASHFTGGPDIWQCKDNKFVIGHGILGFYQKFGGDALCGLTYLGLPTSNELAVTGHPGVVYQRFERGVLAYDGQHTLDSPPASADVYLMHIDEGLGQDPRIALLQAQIDKLQKLPVVANFQQITTVGQRISDDVALIMKLATVI